MIFINDVVQRCKEKGYKITRQGIYLAGKREGFIYENDSGKQLDLEKFDKWLEKATEQVPDNYLSAKDIVKKYHVSQVFAYTVLKDSDCVCKNFGYKGIIYGEEKSVEDVITKYRNKHKYNWEGKENGTN